MQGDEDEWHQEDGQVDPDVVGEDRVEGEGLSCRRVENDHGAPARASVASIAQFACRMGVEGCVCGRGGG